jgi:mRNA-degrading endonuclease toxin of MazEF toxin-antitoxin module
MTRYVPKKGDFVALTFAPQSGHEQKGRRPASVVCVPRTTCRSTTNFQLNNE